MTEQQAAATPAPVVLADQQQNQVKQSLINYALKLYQEFLQVVGNLPREPEHSRQAFIRFEEGMFWLQNSINKATLAVAAPSAAANEPKAPAAKVAAPKKVSKPTKRKK